MSGDELAPVSEDEARIECAKNSPIEHQDFEGDCGHRTSDHAPARTQAPQADETLAGLMGHLPVAGASKIGGVLRGAIVGCSCLSARDYRAAGFSGGAEGYVQHLLDLGIDDVIAAGVAAHVRTIRAEREDGEPLDSPDLMRLRCACGHRTHRHFDSGCGGPTKFHAKRPQCTCSLTKSDVILAWDSRTTIRADAKQAAARALVECTCGYGGFHEPLNKRCERNQAES